MPTTLHAGFALLPFFLGCLAVEMVVLWRREHRAPDASETLANIGCGVGQLAMRPFYETAIAALYVVVYENMRVLTISPSSIAAWTLLFLATDLVYYAYHRLSHHVPVMWAWHGVHHQSTAYDLSVSFRLSWLGGPIERLFYVPFAVVGFPPAMIVALTGLSSFYQFFVHTRAVGRLGPLEWIFNTPSHHRVHHGIEPHYRNHNFGGVLCIWDRLLGTYVREGAEPTYGVLEPFESRSPFTANVRYWQELWRGRRASEWRPVRPALSARMLGYVAAQFVVCAASVSAVTASDSPDALRTAASVVFALTGTITLGALLDDRPWAVTAELGRWMLACVAAVVLPDEARAVVVTLTAGSIAWLLVARVAARSLEPAAEH